MSVIRKLMRIFTRSAEKVCGLYRLNRIISISAIHRRGQVEPIIAIVPDCFAVPVFAAMPIVPRFRNTTIDARAAVMSASSITKTLLAGMYLAFAGAMFAADADSSGNRASVDRGGDHAVAVQVDKAAAMAILYGPIDQAAVSQLTSQTAIPCTLTLSADNPALAKQAAPHMEPGKSAELAAAKATAQAATTPQVIPPAGSPAVVQTAALQPVVEAAPLQAVPTSATEPVVQAATSRPLPPATAGRPAGQVGPSVRTASRSAPSTSSNAGNSSSIAAQPPSAASSSSMAPAQRTVGAVVENPPYSTLTAPCAVAECGINKSGAGCASGTCNSCGQCNECESCFGNCCKCGPQGNVWFRDEYVGWWAQGGLTPALVNSSTTGSLPGNVTLYGNTTYNNDYRSGDWVQGGMWLDCCHTHGIQGDYFFVGRQSSPFFASSDGDPILTRPFTDATTGLPAEELIAVPGIVVGNISIDNHNSLQGAGVLGRCNLCCCCDCCDKSKWCDDCCWNGENCCRTDFVYGFRYYNFADNLGIREGLTSIDPTSGVPIGTQFDISDSFVTQNNFYGGEFGIIRQRYKGRWMTETTAKVALGDMDSIVWINGSTVVSFPGQTTAFNRGGLLALDSNIGRHEHNAFVAIPQINFRIGYRPTERLTLLAGYTFMYFSQIGRAADQIDTTINPQLIPPVTPPVTGPLRPAFNFHPSDLVLQGITLGAEYSF